MTFKVFRTAKWKVGILFPIALLVGCQSKAPANNEETSITICQYGDLLIYLPLYIAQDQNLFNQQGLSVRFINGGGDDKTYAAVSSGAAQFGVADPTFTAIAREKGQPGVVIGTIVDGAPYWGVTWDPKISSIKDPIGLKDLRIATYESPSTNYALMANTLKDHSTLTGKARIVQGSYGSLLAMLKANKADVAMELEPAASTAVHDGAHIVYSYPEMYGRFLLTGIYVLESYRDAHPKQVQGVISALEQAMQLAHQNPMLAKEIARRKFANVPQDVIDSAVDRMIAAATIPEHVTLDTVGWKNSVNVRVSLGDLKSPQTADQALDPTFANRAIALVH